MANFKLFLFANNHKKYTVHVYAFWRIVAVLLKFLLAINQTVFKGILVEIAGIEQVLGY